MRITGHAEESLDGARRARSDRQTPRAEVPMLDDVKRLVTRYTEAFNARDLDGVLEQFDPTIVLSPTRLSASRSCYRGHAELREWFQEVLANPVHYCSRVMTVQELGTNGWIVSGEVLVDGEPMSPYVFTMRVANGRISELTSYLSDEEMLRHLERLP